LKFRAKKYEHLKEEELVELASSEEKNEVASHLFLQYSELVYGVCLKYLKDAHDAEDEVMNIYGLFLKKIKEHKVENVKSWLYVLTKNHCLGVLRKRKRDTAKFDQFSLMYSDDNYHPLEEGTEVDETERLSDCMKNLVELQRICIQSFYYEKQSYEEISGSLNLPWNKIRSNIQNGRRNLKKCLEAK